MFGVMKIVARTSTELIIRDGAMGLRAGGAFLLLFGTLAIIAATTQEPGHVRVTPVVIGTLLGLIGLALIVLPARKTFAFSRHERVLIIATRRLGRVQRQIIPFREIADVSVEESTGTDGGHTYRVAVTLADRRRIPWTPYYTSGSASKQSLVELVREFVALAPSPTLGLGRADAQGRKEPA